MDRKYIVIIALSVIFIALLAMGISYTATKDKNNIIDNKDNLGKDVNQTSNENNLPDDSSEYKLINKNSAVANRLLDFVPKFYQTYVDKMSEDYMLYDAISRLSMKEDVQTVTIGEFYGYKYSDVDDIYKEVYGENLSAPKKASYSVPVEYIKSSDVFCIYPHSSDNTDNMMVVKSVEENDEFYKVTVYSVCVYVDINSNNYDAVYVITKDTMSKFYSIGLRNDPTIVSTYKKFELTDEEFKPEDVVEKYESYLPQIEFYLKKLDERGTKYYVYDIKDIY